MIDGHWTTMEQTTNLLMVLFPLSYLIAANGTMHRGVSQSMELHHDFDRNSRGTAVGDGGRGRCIGTWCSKI